MISVPCPGHVQLISATSPSMFNPRQANQHTPHVWYIYINIWYKSISTWYPSSLYYVRLRSQAPSLLLLPSFTLFYRILCTIIIIFKMVVSECARTRMVHRRQPLGYWPTHPPAASPSSSSTNSAHMHKWASNILRNQSDYYSNVYSLCILYYPRST